MMVNCWIIVSFILMIALHKDFCLGAKLERKQGFFDVESFDNKREYGLSEIGKRGFSTFGFDYSSSEYGIGASSLVNSDYSTTRSSGSDESLSSSPARDLIPPAPFSSSTLPPISRSDYPKFRIYSASVSAKDFLSAHHRHHRNPISRRSPQHHHHQSSLSHYFDEISSIAGGGGARGRNGNPGNFGLVADNDGKLIGYRGSILPGYPESQSIVSSSTSSINPDSANFIGGYFPGPPSIPDYNKPKFNSLTSSASSGSYTSTPVYYPGREEDHTYRMRDTTSQGYDDEEQELEHSPSSEDNDFTVGSSGTYQPSPHPQPPSPPHHYHLRDTEGIHGHSHILETSRFLPYGRDHSSPPSGFSYESVGKNHRHSYEYNTKRSYGRPSNSPPPGYDVHSTNSVERGSSSPFGYMGLGYSDYGTS